MKIEITMTEMLLIVDMIRGNVQKSTTAAEQAEESKQEFNISEFFGVCAEEDEKSIDDAKVEWLTEKRNMLNRFYRELSHLEDYFGKHSKHSALKGIQSIQYDVLEEMKLTEEKLTLVKK